MFKGSFTALITPFDGEKIDEKAYADFIEWQIKEGTHGLVPSGTTGESPTLSHEEHIHVTEICVKVAGGRVPVIAGTGSNSTREAKMMTEHAEKAGADAALIVTPYYNKPTQEGLFQHFKAIHDATGIPIIVYNIPGRSVVDLSDETLSRLVDLPRIAGVKDATGNLSRPVSLAKILTEKGKAEFSQFSGEDATAVEFNQAGGSACISVTSNIAPRLCAELQQNCIDGNFAGAKEIQDSLQELNAAMFCETSPGPVKYAAKLMGLCSGEMRLPLVPPSEANKNKIKAALEALNII